MKLLDFDWPANILAGQYFQAQEGQALSPAFALLAQVQLGMRLTCALLSDFPFFNSL